MLQPWNNWFHCTCNTYGVWLPGDPRGWATRHHRRHVQALQAGRVTRMAQLPARPVVRLPLDLRQQVADEFVARLQQQDIEVIIASLDDHHLHLLGRFRDHRCRHWLGIAKKHTSLWLRRGNDAYSGGIWGKRSRAEPIRSRQHQLATYRYILGHQERGAAIWLRARHCS